jgi:hypothetical protein
MIRRELGKILEAGDWQSERQQEGLLASELRYFSKIYALLYYVRIFFLLFIVKFELRKLLL